MVPDSERELATAFLDGPVGDEVAALDSQAAFAPQPDDDYFVLRSRMDVEMPHSGRRAKERAARRALAELDGRSPVERPDRPSSEGCRKQMLVVMVILLAAMIVFVVAWLANGHGLTDPGCRPAQPGPVVDDGC